MRALVLFGLAIFTWLTAACVEVEAFEDQQFRCNNSGECPSEYWCHSKRLVTGGGEPGNVCVPTQSHYCNGTRCAQGERCSTDGYSSNSGNCVSCPGCQPHMSADEGGGHSNQCQDCGGLSCLGGACAQPCAGPSAPACGACRFVANLSSLDVASGGACAPPAGADCSSSDCQVGDCAIFLLDGGSPALRCLTSGSGGARGAGCTHAQQCWSGICWEGRCRAACTADRAMCECMRGVAGMPAGMGWCK